MDVSSKTIIKILGLTAAFIGLLYLAFLTRHVLFWLVTAFSLAVAMNPLVVKLTQYMPKKSRSLATGTVFIIFFAAIVLFTITLVPPVVSQSQKLIENLPKYSDQLVAPHTLSGDFIRKYQLVDHVKQSQDQIIGRLSSASGSLVDIAKSLFSSIISATTIIVLTFFMLSEGQAWRRRFWALVPLRHRARHQRLAGHMYRSVTGYVVGKLIMSLAAAVPTAIILAILDVPSAISLGIIVGFFDLLPLIGATIGAVIVVIVALFTSSTAALVMIIFFLIYQQIENHVIQQIVFAKSVEISPLLVLVSIIFGAALGNILGALIAIPLTASAQILARDYLADHLQTEAADKTRN